MILFLKKNLLIKRGLFMKKSAVVIIVSALICSMFMTSCGEDKTQQSSVNENSVVSSSVSEVSENSKDEKTEVSEKSKDEKTEVSEESKDEKTEVSEKSETAESVIEEISDPEQVSSIQQIFTMPKAVENFDRVVESLSNDTVTARIFPEGDDTVVIELTAVNEITGDRDMVEAGLEAIVDAGKSNLLQSIKNIEQAMPNIGNVTISVRFYNPDGSFLYSKDLTSDMDDEEMEISDYEDESIPEISIPLNEHYSSLKELFEENYEYFDSVAKENTNEMMETSIFLTDDDKTLVFMFQIKAELTEEQTKQLEDILVEGISASFSDNLIKEFNEMTDEENSVVVRIIDKDYYQLFEQKLN